MRRYGWVGGAAPVALPPAPLCPRLAPANPALQDGEVACEHPCGDLEVRAVPVLEEGVPTSRWPETGCRRSWQQAQLQQAQLQQAQGPRWRKRAAPRSTAAQGAPRRLQDGVPEWPGEPAASLSHQGVLAPPRLPDGHPGDHLIRLLSV